MKLFTSDVEISDIEICSVRVTLFTNKINVKINLLNADVT